MRAGSSLFATTHDLRGLRAPLDDECTDSAGGRVRVVAIGRRRRLADRGSRFARDVVHQRMMNEAAWDIDDPVRAGLEDPDLRRGARGRERRAVHVSECGARTVDDGQPASPRSRARESSAARAPGAMSASPSRGHPGQGGRCGHSSTGGSLPRARCERDPRRLQVGVAPPSTATWIVRRPRAPGRSRGVRWDRPGIPPSPD